jgi:hypothetical protein
MSHEADIILDGIFARDVTYFLVPVYLHFNDRPLHIRTLYGNWDIPRMQEDLAQKLLRSEVRSDVDTDFQKLQLLFRLEKDVFFELAGDKVTIFAATSEAANSHARELTNRYHSESEEEQPSFRILNLSSGHPSTERVPIVRPYVHDPDELVLHYGPDAVEFEEHLINTLNTSLHGTSLFRGEPGTGKTSFIRHLIAKLQETHRFYYLPLDGHRYLASAEMTRFWVTESLKAPDMKKVVVLEDAEALLMDRGPDNRSMVSSLLNIADGLLGDFLKVHLICTINCPIDRLDPAITRPGRLLALREFNRLTREQAERLARRKGLQLPDQPDYSLGVLPID